MWVLIANFEKKKEEAPRTRFVGVKNCKGLHTINVVNVGSTRDLHILHCLNIYFTLSCLYICGCGLKFFYP